MTELKKSAQYTIDAMLYGKKAERPVSKTKIPKWMLKNKKRLNEIEEEIKILDQKVADEEITEEKHTAEAEN